MSKPERKGIPRREFLKTAGLAAGVAGAAGAALTSAPAKAQEPGGDRRRDAGYRETEHVRKYYELARF